MLRQLPEYMTKEKKKKIGGLVFECGSIMMPYFIWHNPPVCHLIHPSQDISGYV
jgi:hypothetical protein